MYVELKYILKIAQDVGCGFQCCSNILHIWKMVKVLICSRLIMHALISKETDKRIKNEYISNVQWRVNSSGPS